MGIPNCLVQGYMERKYVLALIDEGRARSGGKCRLNLSGSIPRRLRRFPSLRIVGG